MIWGSYKVYKSVSNGGGVSFRGGWLYLNKFWQSAPCMCRSRVAYRFAFSCNFINLVCLHWLDALMVSMSIWIVRILTSCHDLRVWFLVYVLFLWGSNLCFHCFSVFLVTIGILFFLPLFLLDFKPSGWLKIALISH